MAADGKTALYRLRDFSYDVVILDLNLPDMSGNEVQAAMRKSDVTTPVLVLTARDGIAAKVAKPFSLHWYLNL